MQVGSFNRTAQLQNKQQNKTVKFTGKKEEAKTSGKNGGPAVASFFVPGLGQLMNGKKAQGAAHMTAGVALPGLGAGVAAYAYKKGDKAVAALATGVGAVATIANSFVASVKAYRDPNTK